MTIQDLSKVRNIKRVIQSKEERLKKLKSTVTNTVSNLSLAPGKGCNDKVGNLSTEIADLKSELLQDLRRSYREKAIIEIVIKNAPDEQLKEIIRLYFIDCLRWKDVANKLGGNNTEDTVRMRCKRYLETIKKQPN